MINLLKTLPVLNYGVFLQTLITIKVNGDGDLIGFDNGNPADHTSMKSSMRNAFNGSALAVIQ
jgi:Glycoside hydrolase family 2 C-terminal domain 5